ncbi:MAG: DUF2062 domain-containing protein [Planctomycetaceae bacterium]|nr:DUF2062 domain-containing protein [Planctomycetaceae bacterium]
MSSISSEVPVKVRERSKESAGKVPATSWSWYVSPQEWLRRIVHLDDSPHSIALGTAIGVFISLTPTVGIQMLLVLMCAWICKPFFRFNRLAGLVAVYISNPVTTLPIYWFNYWVGTFFVAGNVTREALAEALEYHGWREWGLSLTQLLFDFGWPLVIGSLLMGIVCALPTYPVVKWLAASVQHKRHQLELKRHAHKDQTPQI